jgi:hypothetical protein
MERSSALRAGNRVRVEGPAAAADAQPSRMPLAWWLVLLLSTGVAGYALAYVVVGEAMYPPALAESFLARPWGIYPHAFFGMVALALGPFQFHRGLLVRRRQLHRRLGQVYLVSALVTGGVGVYMSLFSFGGIATHVGFGLLGVGLLVCSTMAWRRILRRDIARHREWVVRSFALLFAAVTLRLWLPILVAGFGGFEPAYVVVSWLCWVPNLAAAEGYIRWSRGRHPLRFLRPHQVSA